MHKYLSFVIISFCRPLILQAQPIFGNGSSISFKNGAIAITEGGKSTPFFISSKDWSGVIRAFHDLRAGISYHFDYHGNHRSYQ